MRSDSMALKARKRLMRRSQGTLLDVHGEPDVFGPWVIPVAMAVDPEVRAFGHNLGFSDGSVLVRRLRWRKCRDGLYHYVRQFSAYRF